MSAINMIISNLESLSALERSQVLAHFQTSVQAVEAEVTSEKKKKEKKEPRVSVPTAHGDYTKKVLEENKDQLAAYKLANPEKKGAHLSFVAEYKKAHPEEYASFEAEWKLKHPKVEKVVEPKVVEVAPVAVEADQVKPKSKRPPMTDEHKAKLKAGREAAAAKKKEGTASPARSVSPKVKAE
jgi:hypothetical protein